MLATAKKVNKLCSNFTCKEIARLSEIGLSGSNLLI